LYNAYQFEDGTQILRVLEKETQHWDVNNVNEISISYDPATTTRSEPTLRRKGETRDQALADWYHLDIVNRNKFKHALGCLAYMTRIFDLEEKAEIPTPTNELIWTGIGDITANIMADGRRELDAFFIYHDDSVIHFNQRPLTTGIQRYRLPDLPEGRFLVTDTVLATGFESCSKTYLLVNDGTPEGVRFDPYNSK
jgi:hypothetical protein